MKIKIKGLHKKQLEISNKILESDAKYHIVNASRQSGKSYMITKLMLMFALKYPNEEIMLVSPTYDQSKKVFDNLIAIKNIFKVISKVKNSKPYEVDFKTDTKIVFKSAERFDNIRGGSYRFVFVDEMAFIKSDVFNTVIRPTTAAKKNSKIIGVSTPKGILNEFFELSELGQNKEVDNYEYYYMHYLSNPFYDLTEVDDARIRLPDKIFRQEYDAEFITDGGVVFDNIKIVSVIEAYDKLDENEMYFAGIDFARSQDKTVLTILNSKQDVVFIKDWSIVDWSLIVDELALYLNIYKPIAYAESNGIGDPLISSLKLKYGNIREFVMTNSSKKEIIELLRMVIYKNEIKLPDSKLCKDLTNELLSYTFKINQTGTISYLHPEGGHDDFVDSLAMSNYCYKKHNLSGGPLKINQSKFYNKPKSIYR